ncbi:MAG: diacylglycerol kinase family protein [Devosia sp.]|nr:diacylglycerol kinase family protein [Devosia sp.]
MHFIGVFNKDGGTFRTMDLGAFVVRANEIMAAAGHTLETRIVAGRDLMPELARAAEDLSAQALLVGGGDGTISAAAETCFRTGATLAILPAGTMNLFARSLRIPLNLEEALRAIATGKTARVDIATANGKPFVHQFSVGIHTRLVRIRESLRYRGRWGKMLASLRAFSLAVAQPPRFYAEIRTPRGTEIRRASGITVSNNLLEEGHIPHAGKIDRGVLGVYVVDPMPPLALARFCMQVLLGRWKGHPLVSEREVDFVSLRFRRRRSSDRALIDGELVALDKRVDIEIHPGALRVIAPAVQTAVVAA